MVNRIKKHVLLLFISLTLVSLLRNSGIALTMACFPFMLWASKKNRKYLICIYTGVLFSLFMWFKMILPWAGVEEGTVMANLSIPLQQTARYVLYYGDEITDEEEKAIDKVLDYNKIADTYNPELVDPIRMICRENVRREEVKKYIEVYLHHLKRHPICYLDAFLNKANGYFYPNDRGVQKKYAFVGLHNIESFNEQSGLDIHSVFPRIVNALSVIIESDTLREIPFVGMFFSSGFYSWIFMTCVVFVGKAKWRRKNITIFFPGIFVLIGCVASPCNAYFRYAFPIVMCVPFFILMVFIEKQKFDELNKIYCS